MKRRLLRVVMMVGSTCAALAIPITGAAGASAPTYTVHAGDAPAGYTIETEQYPTQNSGGLTFTDTETGAAIHCASADVALSELHLRSGQTGLPQSNTEVHGCTSPVGSQDSAPLSRTLDVIESVTSSSASFDGAVGIDLVLTTPGGSSCRIDIGGRITFTYSFAYSVLRYTQPTGADHLTVYKARGDCQPSFGPGQSFQFTGVFKFKAQHASYNPITITSP